MLRGERATCSVNITSSTADAQDSLVEDNGVNLPSSFWTWLGIPIMVVLRFLFLFFSVLFTGFKGLNVEPERKICNSLDS